MIHYTVILERQVVRVRRAIVLDVAATDAQDAYRKALKQITGADWEDDPVETLQPFTDVEARALPDMWVHAWRDEGGK